ncbi:MAG: lectin-like protein [Candidatus Thiothrix putei]|uniref:Lectin-like protein n=1 Tax=Candidatus Thiothrix putei TaxID=3080811 RepID=A0AA95HH87_9GAMM|nr:MAG: lectin-like protein [Candidatus Thiothrix putei]
MLTSNQKWLAVALALSSMGLSLNASAATTEKLKWSGNNHYYQQIEKRLTWFGAQDECKSFGGHLATPTSVAEQAFLNDNLLTTSDYFMSYALGGTDENNGTWRWITGEAWSFNVWSYSQPNSAAGRDYMKVFKSGGPSYEWHSVLGTETLSGYICEWSYENHISTATLPDVNGDGKQEIVSLYTDKTNTGFYARLKNASTGAAIGSNVSFGTTATAKPVAVAGLADFNGNGKPEIAVLSYNYATKKPTVTIKDSATGVTLNTSAFLTAGYEALDLSVMADTNGNGIEELSVMGSKAGVATVQIRDASTKALVKQFVM